MMKKWCINMFVVLTAALLACCTQKNDEEPQATGSLTVNVRLSSMISRAQQPRDAMTDVTLLLVNSKNEISTIKSESLSAEEQYAVTVSMFKEDLRLGEYTLYAFGNVNSTSFTEAKTLLDGLKEGDVFDSANMDILFDSLDGTETPAVSPSHPMLLTASTEVQINNLQNNTATIDLVRPIVWFEVRLRNHSEKDMAVTDLSFSNFNPSTGYLLPHDGKLPAYVQYRELPPYDKSKLVTVAAGEQSTVYSVTLFENRAESYLMNMTLTAEGETAGLTNAKLMTINGETADVTPMTEQLRNQHIIVTVDAYYNKDDAQFRFELSSWNNKEENVEFN